MNWIRLQSEYFRHRKTLRIVRKLGELAALYPLKLWTWAVEQSPDGSLRDIDAEELTVICGHKGDAAELWAAMLDCGFLQTYEGETFIRSWKEHQGKLIERAERNAERMRAARSRNVPDTEPEEIQQPETRKPEPAQEFPPALDTEAFRAAWELWRKYRAERHLAAWRPLTIRTQLAKLAEMGETRAIAAIDHSIAQAYQGIYEPKPGQAGAGGATGYVCNRCKGKGSVYPHGLYGGAPEPCKRCQGTGIAT